MIFLKTDREIERMRECGKILALAHEAVEAAIRPGVTTAELDAIARRVIEENGAKPSFLGLYGYPATINASINEEVIHGLPSARLLREGDIIGIDIGAFKDGFHTDAARTHAVGAVSEAAARLVRVTRECFFEAVRFCRKGFRISDISRAIEMHAVKHGYSLVRDFTGHGVGRSLHEDPHVPNYVESKDRGVRLEAGMTLAIEPMVNAGRHPVVILDDGWTVVTRDGKLSAHYENTVVITDGEPEILTLTSAERRLELGDIIRV